MSGVIFPPKIIPIVLMCAIIVLFVQSCDIMEYREYHTIPTVSGEQTFLSEGTLKKWPLSEQWIVDMIDNSQKRVWVALYTFTLPSLREALVRAKKRGVDVRIILEKFPFWNTSLNRETQLFLEKNKIPLHQSGEKQFAFMHAKYMLFDDTWMLETANWTRASFSSNREFFLSWKDSEIYQNLEHIFLTDFDGWTWKSNDVRLLAWPTNARERIIDFLDETKKAVDIYAPSFSDAGLLTKLSQLCYEKKIIRILLANYDEENTQKPDYGTCIQVRKMKKPLHAKSIVRDEETAFVGSFNYTKNSLENNREIGVFMTWEGVKGISQSFESDWKQSEVALR